MHARSSRSSVATSRSRGGAFRGESSRSVPRIEQGFLAQRDPHERVSGMIVVREGTLPRLQTASVTRTEAAALIDAVPASEPRRAPLPAPTARGHGLVAACGRRAGRRACLVRGGAACALRSMAAESP